MWVNNKTGRTRSGDSGHRRGCTHGGLGPCGPSGPPLQEAGLSPRESSQAEPIHGPQAETTPVTNEQQKVPKGIKYLPCTGQNVCTCVIE